MSRRSRASKSRHTTGSAVARRLRDSSPWLYRLTGPVARTVRRAIGLAADTLQSFRTVAQLKATPPRGSSGPHILIDGCAFQESHEGIARVWATVLQEWSATGFADHITVIDRGTTVPHLPGYTYLPLPRVRVRDSGSQRRVIERACRVTHADLFVSTLYTTPKRTPSLLLVNDLTPQVLGWDMHLPIWREIGKAIDYASSFICISANTASDLHRLYPQTQALPLTVAPLGVGASFRPSEPAAVDHLRATYDLPDNYFVFIGHRDGHKNARLVFEALAHLDNAPGIGLLFVGGAPELEARFAQQANGAEVRVARLSDDELRAAYTGAAALLYPSLYEGFGLPVLEAMACGCPVICGRNSSLPEVAGDGALFIDVTDAATLADAMRSVMAPQTRADLVRRGFANLKRFSWERTAELCREAIEAAASAASEIRP